MELQMDATIELGNGPTGAPTRLTVRLGQGRGSPEWSPGTVATADRMAIALLGVGALVSTSGGGRTYIPQNSAEWKPVAPQGPTPR